jgi:hypothetical protein
MASRWRRRTMCVLIVDRPCPAALRDVSASARFSRPTLARSRRQHRAAPPEAGAIAGTVRSIAGDGIAVGFDCTEQSVAFAMAAIAADMSQPAA